MKERKSGRLNSQHGEKKKFFRVKVRPACSAVGMAEGVRATRIVSGCMGNVAAILRPPRHPCKRIWVRRRRHGAQRTHETTLVLRLVMSSALRLLLTLKETILTQKLNGCPRYQDSEPYGHQLLPQGITAGTRDSRHGLRTQDHRQA